MHILYIGHYDDGSTSKMRGQILQRLLQPNKFDVVNIDVPLAKTPKILRSIGWRYKVGPLIKNINNYLLNCINGNFAFNLVWVDKGVFIDPFIISQLRKHSNKLIHYTPDPAFTYHRSELFYKAITFYDYCVTTKSYELDDYNKFGVKPILCTQGYDSEIHRNYYDFYDKEGVVFIGHREAEREYLIAKLLEREVKVTIAGNHWSSFARKQRHNKFLIYKGKGIFGVDYARELSKAKLGLGLLSRWVPELHTTRTFEIPACGTALVTERNIETCNVFTENEAIFYSTPEEFISKTLFYLRNEDALKSISEAGNKVIKEGGYSYVEILKRILNQIGEPLSYN